MPMPPVRGTGTVCSERAFGSSIANRATCARASQRTTSVAIRNEISETEMAGHTVCLNQGVPIK
jgi:hypothetical protein